MIERARCLGLAAASLAVVAALAGCAQRGTVVLLPASDGKPAAVSVKQGEREVVLDQPYAAAHVTPSGPTAYRATAQDVDAQFGPALAARPSRPASFTLYFVEGGDEFTAESKQLVDRLLGEIARRPVPDVRIVGHTDAVGNDASNDALGKQRAEVVRAALVRVGVPEADIETISRGKRELAVPTPDGVAEPRNRRVEIIVR
jgi:OOP family OmpA-OmpF porin